MASDGSDSTQETRYARFSGRTAWARSLETPLRSFLRTETGGAAVLLGGDSPGPRVGERRCVVLRRPLVDRALDPDRGCRRRARPSRLGEQRADDVLLLRPRARSAARVRPRRVPRAATVRAARARGNRRHDLCDRHLPGVQRGTSFGARLGRDDVDRHGLRARDAGARRPALPRPPAGVDADGRRRRRHPRARRDRDRVHGGRQDVGAARRARPVRRPRRRAIPQGQPRLRLRGARHGPLGRAPQIGRRAGHRRPGDRSAHLRVPGRPVRPRAGDRAVPTLPRAADARAGAAREPRCQVRGLAERAVATALPPLDELRDRAACSLSPTPGSSSTATS